MSTAPPLAGRKVVASAPPVDRTVMSFTNTGRQIFFEAVPGTLIRLSTTAFTSGTCAYRVYFD